MINNINTENNVISNSSLLAAKTFPKLIDAAEYLPSLNILINLIKRKALINLISKEKIIGR